MDREALLLSLAVVAVGCTHVGTGSPSTGSSQGLVVEDLSVSDDSLGSGQTGIVTLRLRNYHRQDVEIEDISLYNTGVLDVGDRSCSPPPSNLEDATEDYTPGMECRWPVKVKEGMEGFESRTIPVKLNLEYRSKLSNSRDPIQLHFMPLEEIESTGEVRESFSNGEVEMEILTESPVPLQGRTLEVTARNAGPGTVTSDYSFEYSPQGVISGCPETPEPVVDQEVTFTCDLDPGQSATRSLVFSTSYKYVKAPTLDIEVVNR